MSWHRAGFPAIFATEGDPLQAFNPYIHTENDKMDLKDGEFSFEVRSRHLSWRPIVDLKSNDCKHALEFAKVAVGFAVELGGWTD